jgi:hypothetical protein
VVVGLLAAALATGAADLRVRQLRAERKGGGWLPPRLEPICDVVAQKTADDEGIYVWGFSGDLYITCRRHAVSRHVTPITVAGIVPPFWGSPNPKYVAPGARKTLLAELEAARSPIILDVPGMLGTFTMNRVPELAAFLNAQYCDLGPISGKGGLKARRICATTVLAANPSDSELAASSKGWRLRSPCPSGQA